jgi:predicted tellurium resistance membrane protein TerC
MSQIIGIVIIVLGAIIAVASLIAAAFYVAKVNGNYRAAQCVGYSLFGVLIMFAGYIICNCFTL